MEEIQRGKPLEIPVKGDEPIIAREAKSGEVSIRPQVVREHGRAGQGLKVFVKASRLRQKTQKCAVMDVSGLAARRVGFGRGLRRRGWPEAARC